MFSMKPSLRFSSRSGKRKRRGGEIQSLAQTFFRRKWRIFSRLPFSKWDLWLQKADFRGGKGTLNIFAWASFFPELHLHTLQFRGFLQRGKKFDFPLTARFLSPSWVMQETFWWVSLSPPQLWLRACCESHEAQMHPKMEKENTFEISPFKTEIGI